MNFVILNVYYSDIRYIFHFKIFIFIKSFSNFTKKFLYILFCGINVTPRPSDSDSTNRFGLLENDASVQRGLSRSPNQPTIKATNQTNYVVIFI